MGFADADKSPRRSGSVGTEMVRVANCESRVFS
jgi:hypothetical protein